MIRERISSAPSKRPSTGDPRDDRANCGVDDRKEGARGDADLIGSSAVVAVRGGVGERILESTRSASRAGDESRR